VPEELLLRVLETATWAPSSHNRQPWRFVVLTSDDAKLRLANAMGAEYRNVLLAEGLASNVIEAQLTRSRLRIKEAPVAIVLCLDPSDMDHYDDPNREAGERTMAVQSVALAGGNLLMAAHAEGLGGVWVCAPLFTPVIVQEALAFPSSWIAQGMILMGYPAKIPAPRPRSPLTDIARFL
jgi:F420 biosynthesis protein FbiB-like protein